MFVLFNLNSNQSIGLYDEIKPFTRAIYIDDPDIIQKVVTKQVVTTSSPEQYIDRFGVITNKKTPFNKLLKTTTENNIIANIKNHPELFTYDEIIEFRQQELLSQYPKYDKCLVIESYFDKYMDFVESNNFQVGNNTLIINNGKIRLNPIQMDDCKTAEIIIQCDGEYTLYINANGKKFTQSNGILKKITADEIAIEIRTDKKVNIDAIFILY